MSVWSLKRDADGNIIGVTHGDACEDGAEAVNDLLKPVSLKSKVKTCPECRSWRISERHECGEPLVSYDAQGLETTTDHQCRNYYDCGGCGRSFDAGSGRQVKDR